MVAIKYIQIETLGFILIRCTIKYGNNELMACIFNADKHNLMVLHRITLTVVFSDLRGSLPLQLFDLYIVLALYR